MTVDASEIAAPGWYEDPGRRHAFRYWDGARWTDGVADGDLVTEDPLPLSAEPPTSAACGPGRLPLQGVWYALIGLIGAVLLGLAGAVLGILVARHVLVVRLVLGQLGLWAGLVVTCRLASRRLGTGDIRRDFGIFTTVGDIGRGVGMAFVARIVAAVVAVILLAIDKQLVGSNLTAIKHLRSTDRAAFLVLAVLATVGAPLVEETFFRGLLLRSLLAKWRPGVAIVLQAVLFGCCHASPVYGLRNVSVVAVTASGGVVFGWLAVRYGRLGPGMVAHATFNAIALVALAAA
jgi:membrane protease YdiL (CAAX protease family)